MRLVTFVPTTEKNTAAGRLGCLTDDDRTVLDLSAYGAHEGSLRSMEALIESGEAGLAAARELQEQAKRDRSAPVYQKELVQLLLPVRPRLFRACSLFPGHLRAAALAQLKIQAASMPDPESALARMIQAGKAELPADWLELPRYYTGNHLSFIGTNEDVDWPPYSEMLDYEVEFGVIIGKTGKDIPRSEASQYIFGYTVFIDISARDMQIREIRGYGKSKDFDTGNILGPCIVTPDEIPDPYNLRMTCRVNGELRSDSNSSKAARTFEDLIAHISISQTVHAGEFMSSGTVDGGCGLESLRFLKPDDTIEVEVERIGVLRSQIRRRAATPA